MKRLVSLATVVLALAGCASQNLPLAPAKAAVPDYKYLIGPGDNLNIIVWRNPELSMAVPVRPDGKLTSPLIEDLVAIGKNPSDLAREIEKRLTRYIQDPVVTVVVNNFVGPTSEQIRIVGSATRPSALPYRQNMTVLDAMIAVGGITDYAAGNRAVLIRASDRGRQFTLRLKDLLKGGDVSANADLRPGDVIIIPEGWF
ncbi:MAG: XrtA/PEP-CTERM system exopolysaccharide export protein [Burkholderiales bacterium]|jgi:polysaccharide export outer membrane protein